MPVARVQRCPIPFGEWSNLNGSLRWLSAAKMEKEVPSLPLGSSDDS